MTEYKAATVLAFFLSGCNQSNLSTSCKDKGFNAKTTPPDTKSTVNGQVYRQLFCKRLENLFKRYIFAGK